MGVLLRPKNVRGTSTDDGGEIGGGEAEVVADVAAPRPLRELHLLPPRKVPLAAPL